jgi:cytochrome P450
MLKGRRLMTTSIVTLKGLPLIGNLLDFAEDSFKFTNHVAPSQGRIVRLNLAGRNFFVVSHPDEIQQILRDKTDVFVKGATGIPFKKISGEALVNMEGADWLKRRREMQPHFHRKQVMTMLSAMQAAIEAEYPKLDKLAETGDSVDMVALFRELTAQVFTQSFYGMRLSEEDAHTLAIAMNTMLNYVWGRYLIFGFMPEWMPFPGKDKFLKARQFLTERSMDLIQRRKTMDNGNDLLAMMMGMDGSESSFTDQELLQETVSLFQGGFDTSSATLAWIMYNLTKYPDVANKFQAEIDSVLEGGTLAHEVIQRFTYVHQVIQETMRLDTSVANVLRVTTQDTTLNGQHIPANSYVLISILHTHRLSEFWENPDTFDPERFANGKPESAKHAFAYIPFANGTRMCIGDQFALYEMRLVLALLYKRYRFTLDPNFKLETSRNSIYIPKTLCMRLTRR